MDQGVARACHRDGFHHLGAFDKAPGTVQSPGVCASGRAAGMVPSSIRDLQHCASVVKGSQMLLFFKERSNFNVAG